MIRSCRVASTTFPAFNVAVELCIDVLQRLHLNFESESHFERSFARARALQFHFVRIPVHPHENLRERNIFLGVEIVRQILEGLST